MRHENDGSMPAELRDDPPQNVAEIAVHQAVGEFVDQDQLAVGQQRARECDAQAEFVVEAAGFVYVGESKVLADPADDHTKKVFDSSIRGKTDQFIFKFKKPRK